jgi:hypothetical protein
LDETAQPRRSPGTIIRRRRREGSPTPVPRAAQPALTVIAGNDLGFRFAGDYNGKPIAAIAVVINLAAATYWLAGALQVMGMITTGATIVNESGAGLFHALAMTPPILALLALAFVPSNRPLWMLALLLNGALALGIRERVMAGLQRARAQGTVLGRPKAPLPVERLATVAQLSLTDGAVALGVSRSTLKRWRRGQKSLSPAA